MLSALLASLLVFSVAPTARADSPVVTFQVCRASAGPCQKVINISEGETLTLDLILDGLDAGSPLPVVAWETHYQFTNTSVIELVPSPTSGEPVQEQGDAGLALDGLTRLRSSADEGTGQYYTAQNQYDSGLGQLDYAVTLLGFGPAIPQPRVLPFSNQAQLLLGRITLKGVAPGSTDLVAGTPAGDSFQAVTVTGSDELKLLGAAFSTPLLTINVGSASAPEFLGQVVPQTSSGITALAPFPLELTVTFWQEGAIPPWLGGGAKPMAVFRNVITDEQGIFRITNILPSVLPPGKYDLRIKGLHTLATLSPGVTLSSSSGPNQAPAPVSVSLENLLGGDVDGNNIVDSRDLLALKASFAKLTGETGFNGNADFNGDQVVDVQDFSSLSRNFNRRGE